MIIGFFFTKKSFIGALLIYLLFSTSLKSQDVNSFQTSRSKYFHRLHVGYGFVPNSSYTVEGHYKNGDITSQKATRFSWGKGLAAGYSFGLWVNKAVGIEVGFSYQAGGYNKNDNVYRIDTVAFPYRINQVSKSKMNLLRFGPGVTFKGEINNIVSGYGRLNVWYGIGKGKWDIEENATFDNGGTGRGSFEWEITGVKAFGFGSALGLTFKSDDILDVFVEFSYTGMGGTYEKAKRTEYIINNQDLLNTLSTSQRETVYVDELDYTESQGQNEPTKALKTWQSMSNVGFNVGILLNMQ